MASKVDVTWQAFQYAEVKLRDLQADERNFRRQAAMWGAVANAVKKLDVNATHQEINAAIYAAMAESCDTAVYNINLKLIEATWQVEQTRKAYNEAVDESRTVVRNTDDQDR